MGRLARRVADRFAGGSRCRINDSISSGTPSDTTRHPFWPCMVVIRRRRRLTSWLLDFVGVQKIAVRKVSGRPTRNTSTGLRGCQTGRSRGVREVVRVVDCGPRRGVSGCRRAGVEGSRPVVATMNLPSNNPLDAVTRCEVSESVRLSEVVLAEDGNRPAQDEMGSRFHAAGRTRSVRNRTDRCGPTENAGDAP